MNCLAKAALRFSNLTPGMAGLKMLKNTFAKTELTRNLRYMSKIAKKPNLSHQDETTGTVDNFIHPSERELCEFLTQEILDERKMQQKHTQVPTTLNGFSIKVDGAEVELLKQEQKEKIVINFNVNHTVDAEDDPEENPEKSDNLGVMRSKPRFEVDIIKQNTTLSFTCSFLEGQAQEGEYEDIFAIDEMSIYEGEWNDKVYAIAGDVLDGCLYDLLMNFLEEKGISNEFAEKLSDLATSLEHAAYVRLLEKLSEFTTYAK